MFFFPYYYISLMKIFNYRLIAHLFIWIDILFLTIHFAIILHNALTLVMMISITTIYQIHVLKKINSSLRLIAIQSHSINHPIVNGIYRSSFNLSEQITLMQLLIEHNRICQYIHHSSREIFSNLLFRILMLFFPSHLLGVSALWNQLGFWYDKLLISLIIFFEDFLLFPLYFIANQSKLLHRPQRNLLSIIHGIRRPLSLKIKYDHFFERLTTEPYYGYSIANIGTITYRMIFSVSYIISVKPKCFLMMIVIVNILNFSILVNAQLFWSIHIHSTQRIHAKRLINSINTPTHTFTHDKSFKLYFYFHQKNYEEFFFTKKKIFWITKIDLFLLLFFIKKNYVDLNNNNNSIYFRCKIHNMKSLSSSSSSSSLSNQLSIKTRKQKKICLQITNTTFLE